MLFDGAAVAILALPDERHDRMAAMNGGGGHFVTEEMRTGKHHALAFGDGAIEIDDGFIEFQP